MSLVVGVSHRSLNLRGENLPSLGIDEVGLVERAEKQFYRDLLSASTAVRDRQPNIPAQLAHLGSGGTLWSSSM